MSSPTDASTACEQYERLLSRRGEPGSLDDTQQRFLREHAEGCERCHTVETVLDTLRWDEDDIPCAPLDELSRRRLLNDVVARTKSQVAAETDATGSTGEPAAATPPTEAPAGSRPRGGRLGLAWALTAGAALIALALWWAPWQRGPRWTLQRALPTASASSGAPGARYLLLAGTVRSPAGSAALHQTLRPGQWVETGKAGRAVLRLPAGATVLLGADTRLRLGTPDTRSVTLERGELLALVDPQQPRSRFVVVTPKGRVVVKGTVFQVAAGARTWKAAVLRGRVQVESPRHPRVELGAGHRVTLGDSHPTPLSPAHAQRLWQRLRLLDLLQTDRPASLVVTSHPVGALVAVDGVSLGSTPLAISLRPGHRRLELTAPAHDTIRERVLLEADSQTTRDFELKPARPARMGSSAPPAAKKPPQAARRAGQGAAPRAGSAPTRDRRRALLNRAQLLRAARDWRGAEAAYRELIRRYPGTAEAATARVSVGILLLRNLGRPAQALRAFERYLRGSSRGALAQEAAYGRILALRALGRRAREIRALRGFVVRYPRALRIAAVKRRLVQLTGGGAPAKPPRTSKGQP